MSVLDHLEPKGVFRFFEELCAIPHGSGNTKAISDWCVAFARERGLEYHQDDANNVILIKAASPGYEDAPAVILQGHLDMVCEQTPECGKDMTREGLDLAVEGDLILAKGTTLGGDDGIAVAMALAALDDDSLPHPRLEAVLTVDEEVGMLGAAALDVAPLAGKWMLNIDSEEEGVFTVSCAGGSMATAVLPVSREPFGGTAVKLTLGGLAGGHSGVEIDKGRGNSNQLMGRVLYAVSRQTALRLIAVEGGMKDNAIPRETAAWLIATDPDAVLRTAEALDGELRREYRVADPGVFLRAELSGDGRLPMDEGSTQRTLCLLTCAPGGIQEMSADIPGLVQTSLNMGVLTSEETMVRATFCVRSSVDSQKEMVKERLTCLAEALGGKTSFEGEYPAWEYSPHSPLRELMETVFQEQYGYAPKVEAIHGGVECGILADKLPGLDCVSFGPDLTGVHTPRERLSAASVARVWAFVTEVLRRCK